MKRRNFLKVALATSTAATTSACFGSFPAIRWVYGLNKDISNSKFVQWLVFLALNIIPVYSIAGFIDIWILNSLEFWFGSSPMSKRDEKQRVVQLSDDETLTLDKDHDAGVLEMHYQGPEKSVTLRMEMHEDGARLLDGRGRRVARVAQSDDGGVKVFAGGRLLTHYDADQVDDLTRTWDRGGSTAVASWAADRAPATETVARR